MQLFFPVHLELAPCHNAAEHRMFSMHASAQPVAVSVVISSSTSAPLSAEEEKSTLRLLSKGGVSAANAPSSGVLELPGNILSGALAGAEAPGVSSGKAPIPGALEPPAIMSSSASSGAEAPSMVACAEPVTIALISRKRYDLAIQRNDLRELKL
jgi:hypothetical protein